ncbi:hypothetical protein AKG16_00935 [Morganella morganii]|nr:hypothetical protein AKG16_00935 [Morganella morganii]
MNPLKAISTLALLVPVAAFAASPIVLAHQYGRHYICRIQTPFVSMLKVGRNSQAQIVLKTGKQLNGPALLSCGKVVNHLAGIQQISVW